MPLAVVCVILMQLLPSEVRPLVPALQSTWLHVHVTLAMLSYAACAVSFALAMMFLIQDHFQTRPSWPGRSALGQRDLHRHRRHPLRALGRTLGYRMGRQQQSPICSLAAGCGCSSPSPIWAGCSSWRLLAAIVPLASLPHGAWKKDDRFLGIANKAIFISILLQVVVLAAFVLRVRNASYPSPDQEGLFPTSLAASPFLLGGMVTGIFGSLLYLMLLWRRSDLEALLPSADTLDRITYKTICIAFPLLTGMIAAGAYWANRTWGSYWSWDPKETWAAITWLVYAGYLHMRITRGWRGRRAAYFAILGFGVVIFTFLGVTYLLPGLHAYA